MIVVRARPSDHSEDYDVVKGMLEHTRETGERVVRVWTPHRLVAFGRKDSRLNGFERAKVRARDFGYTPVVRRVGGHAVAYTGDSDTVTFATTFDVDDMAKGLDKRYEKVEETVKSALENLGFEVTSGEPPQTFCPGDYSLSTPEGKIVGIAQRITREAALVSGVVIVENDDVAEVLNSVYDALGIKFDPDTVGRLRGKSNDETEVKKSIENSLIDLHGSNSVREKDFGFFLD